MDTQVVEGKESKGSGSTLLGGKSTGSISNETSGKGLPMLSGATQQRVSVALDYLEFSQEIRSKFKETGVTEEDIEDAVEWARSA